MNQILQIYPSKIHQIYYGNLKLLVNKKIILMHIIVKSLKFGLVDENLLRKCIRINN